MVDPDRIVNMASAFYESCVLFTASDLGIFKKISELESVDAATIANELNLSERCTRLLLDACVALGLLEKENNEYKNTPESSAFLTSGSPADLSGAIRYNRDVYPLWGKLKEMVKSGKPVEKPEVHLGNDEERTRTFVMSMHYRALGIGQAVIPQLELSGRKKVFDVGGGPGTYSVLMAKANPELNCTVFDLPEVVKIAKGLIANQGMSERVQVIGGDYHTDSFPRNNDIVTFFGVLHQESPESIKTLLKKAYDALNPGGVIYVMDMMTDKTHTKPKFSALFGINMALTAESGWVFSDEELKNWLEEASFTNFKVSPLPPPMPHWLASAKKDL